MKNIVVLGTGLVGKAMIIDLAKQYEVTAIDISKDNLDQLSDVLNVRTVISDISEPDNLNLVIKDADLVVGAVPGFMGYKMVQNVIKAGKDIIDISFFPEDPLTLNELAIENNVTAIVDCGVSPGMGNILLGHHINRMNVESYKCLVGGLPVNPEPPWGYKAVFSPIDVIEEYTRPVRYKTGGEILIDEPLSKMEVIEFENVGQFEAWNTDGLRTLLYTTEIPNMIELTIRHTGTINPIIALRDSGFFLYDEIEIDGKKVKPIDVTTKLMFSQWKMKPGEEDMTIMRIVIEGENEKHTYDLVDYFDKTTKTTSMARTTGYTCTAAANLFLEGKYSHKGIIAPEILGQDDTTFEYILNYLMERGVNYIKQKEHE